VKEARQEHRTKEKVGYHREVKWVNGIGYCSLVCDDCASDKIALRRNK